MKFGNIMYRTYEWHTAYLKKNLDQPCDLYSSPTSQLYDAYMSRSFCQITDILAGFQAHNMGICVLAWGLSPQFGYLCTEICMGAT